MIAVDTSILVDYIGDGTSADEAEQLLRSALSNGPVVACEVVVSEVVAGLGHSDIVLETLEAIGIGFSPLELRSALRAGEMQRRYRQRGGNRTRTVADFLIGSHAMMQCDALITRDAGFYRDYFKGLRIVVPGSA